MTVCLPFHIYCLRSKCFVGDWCIILTYYQLLDRVNIVSNTCLVLLITAGFAIHSAGLIDPREQLIQ